MRVPVVAVLLAVLALGGVVWASQRGGESPAPQGHVVVARRGEVVVTVGGVGHVDTLSGAARLAVPAAGGSAGGGATGGAAAASGSGAATASGGGAATASGGGAATASGGGAAAAPADAVFPSVTGHVTHLLVRVGDRVVAGQPIATLADDGTTAGNLLLARGDLATARLELAQKQVQDPARGVPPTAAELATGGQAVIAARDRLRQVVGPPLPANVAAARLELARAVADRRSVQAGRGDAMTAAGLTVATARQRLDLVLRPDSAEVAAAQLELAKAALDQEALLQPAPAPSALAVSAADAAIALAQQQLSDALASGSALDVATARAELARAQAERDALLQVPPPPTTLAREAAQLAVDAAQSRLDALVRPPAATVTAARAELATAHGDLAALRATRGRVGLGAARAAVTAARRRLQQVLGPPTPDLVSAAGLDLRRARADVAVLRQRGSPAAASDLALARLRVDVAAQQVALADELAHRLTARANATGTVTSVLTTTGAEVDPATPIVRVQDLDHLVVSLDLTEFDVGRTHVGAEARISVDALGGQKFTGRVIDVALSGVDNGGVVSFPVIIALDARGRLRPGMSVSARIVVRRRAYVVRIPLAAVVDHGGRPTVTVRAPSGTLTQRSVKLGLTGKQLVEVRSGLRAGERVVVPSGA